MLDFNYTLLIQFLNFLILLVLLNFLLFKPVLRVLQKRKSAIQSLADSVRETQEKVEGLAKQYEDGMKEGRRPILAEREASLKEAGAVSMGLIEEARQELTEELAKVKETVRGEAERTLSALKAEADKLSVEIVKKIVKR